MKAPQSKIVPGNPDYPLLFKLRRRIEGLAGGRDRLRAELPVLFRKAIDEVIDTPRTGRLLLDQLEKTEKTYIGTKIEILFRSFLGLPKGLLDLDIDGQDVDIKNTVRSNWMIPTEAIDKPCVLIACDEERFECHLGLIVAKLANLSLGKNKDSKRSISAAGMTQILWLLEGEKYPGNFWATINAADAKHIMDLTVGGSERLCRLFLKVQNIPVSRTVVQGVARQDDYMKRVRANGGARDVLAPKGIALLSGKYDSRLIKKLKLPLCSEDEFISYRPVSKEHARLLAAGRHKVKWPTI